MEELCICSDMLLSQCLLNVREESLRSWVTLCPLKQLLKLMRPFRSNKLRLAAFLKALSNLKQKLLEMEWKTFNDYGLKVLSLKQFKI